MRTSTTQVFPIFFSLFCAIFCLLLLSPLSFAGEYYPPRLAPRLMGTSQGMVGDCEAEAQVNALEQAFAIRKLPVRLSLFHRHAFIRRKFFRDNPVYMLDLNSADQQLLDRTGEILPEFMWPEDGKGYPEVASIRPRPSEAIAFDPDFPHTSAFGFETRTLVMTPGYQNSIDFDTLRKLISSGSALTISIHSVLLQPRFSNWKPNHVTGLFEGIYSLDALKKELSGKSPADGLDHSVQIIGYDDQLYRNPEYTVPGALIIRNTWNDDSSNRYVLDPDLNIRFKREIERFRLKIHSINLPGFYAIPMQYIADLISLKLAVIKHMTLNFGAYSDAYLRVADRYRIIRAPFACETKNAFDDGDYLPAFARTKIAEYRKWLVLWRNRSETPARKREALRNIRFLSEEASVDLSNRLNRKFIYYATLPVNLRTGTDRSWDFYSGKFTSYYCDSRGESRLWPSRTIAVEPMFQEALSELSLNASSAKQWNKMLYALTLLEADKSK